MSRHYTDDRGFDPMVWRIGRDLLAAPQVQNNFWQSRDISQLEAMLSYEIMQASIDMTIPVLSSVWTDKVQPNLPWAEDHFQERVSGQPLNPPPSEAYWPFAQEGNKLHKDGEIFSHTYPERFWPRRAGKYLANNPGMKDNWGVRYRYGDLHDMIDLMVRDPFTRQAYLPVWFPEDTGAAKGQRVPCTLGYHFLRRNGVLHTTYYIRSCDFMRHWRDDVYMAGRLNQWVCNHLSERKVPTIPGSLTMHIASFHIFHGDISALTLMLGQLQKQIDRDMYERITSWL